MQALTRLPGERGASLSSTNAPRHTGSSRRVQRGGSTDAPAGPALRAAGLARGLAAQGLDVVLVAPDGSRAPDGCGLAPLDDVAEDRRARGDDGRLGVPARAPPCARAMPRHLVVDAAGPFLLENLVVHQTQPPARRRRVLADEAAVLARLLAAADLVLCAHDRQRDLTLGMMLASGALRPELIDDGREPERALPRRSRSGRPPRSSPSSAARARRPAAPRLARRPVGLARSRLPRRARSRRRAQRGADVTAELWGARSPDPLVPPSRAAALVAERARELGVADAIEIVDWVPHAERRARLASRRCRRDARRGRHRGPLRVPHAPRRCARSRAAGDRDRGRVRRRRGCERAARDSPSRRAIPRRSPISCSRSRTIRPGSPARARARTGSRGRLGVRADRRAARCVVSRPTARASGLAVALSARSAARAARAARDALSAP